MAIAKGREPSDALLNTPTNLRLTSLTCRDLLRHVWKMVFKARTTAIAAVAISPLQLRKSPLCRPGSYFPLLALVSLLIKSTLNLIFAYRDSIRSSDFFVFLLTCPAFSRNSTGYVQSRNGWRRLPSKPRPSSTPWTASSGRRRWPGSPRSLHRRRGSDAHRILKTSQYRTTRSPFCHRRRELKRAKKEVLVKSAIV